MTAPFDPFRDDSQVEGVGGGDDPADDKGVGRLGIDVVDECLVDLDRAERERAQHRQRRVTRAEVVEIDVDPGRADRSQIGDDPGEVDDGRTFGDLDADQLWGQAVVVNRGEDVRQAGVGGELDRRNI